MGVAVGLYQQMILDHNRHPRNFRMMENPDRTAAGDNPLCGDKVTVYLKLDGDKIEDICFFGDGCAISQASASLMTEAVLGKSVGEANDLFGKFRGMVVADGSGGGDESGLGKLRVFGGVRAFPARVKCANLAWHTLSAALNWHTGTVSTE